jgi:hypothetical protein
LPTQAAAARHGDGTAPKPIPAARRPGAVTAAALLPTRPAL